MTPTRAQRRAVSACMLGSYDGVTLPTWLVDRVREGLGGVLLFAQNVVDDRQVAEVCAILRDAREDVVIAIDEEGGDVTRLDAATGSAMPSPAAFGVVDDPSLTRAAFAALGHRLHALGIDLTLAPCADINSNPLNPIIGLRSFGTSADVVARHTAAAVEGFRSSGLSVSLKHYPGHGDTCADTHLQPARIDVDLETLLVRELVPFDAAIAAGADSVLTAHIIASALDTEPVSLSVRWAERLRASGFVGAIVTDALDMDAVALGCGVEGVADAAVRALAAGADLLCLGSNFTESMTDLVIDRAARALAEAELDADELGSSATRVRALRRREPAADDPTVVEAGARAATTVARGAIEASGSLPGAPYAVIECRPRLSMACFNVAWGIAADARASGWPCAVVQEDDAVAPLLDKVIDELLDRGADLPLVLVTRDLDIQPWQRVVAERCATLIPGRVVVVEMGWPSTRHVDGVCSVVTYGAARASAEALLTLLRGDGLLNDGLSNDDIPNDQLQREGTA